MAKLEKLGKAGLYRKGEWYIQYRNAGDVEDKFKVGKLKPGNIGNETKIEFDPDTVTYHPTLVEAEQHVVLQTK